MRFSVRDPGCHDESWYHLMHGLQARAIRRPFSVRDNKDSRRWTLGIHEDAVLYFYFVCIVRWTVDYLQQRYTLNSAEVVL